jgi:hypothetical protein
VECNQKIRILKVLINQERRVREKERMQLKCYIIARPGKRREPRYEFIDDCKNIEGKRD